MPRLQSLKSGLSVLDTRTTQPMLVSDIRLTGRRNQDRRWRLWTKDPHCQRCGRLVDFPHGFQVDHIMPLFKGGSDTDANCQVLCSGQDGCHAIKTLQDASSAEGYGGW